MKMKKLLSILLMTICFSVTAYAEQLIPSHCFSQGGMIGFTNSDECSPVVNCGTISSIGRDGDTFQFRGINELGAKKIKTESEEVIKLLQAIDYLGPRACGGSSFGGGSIRVCFGTNKANQDKAFTISCSVEECKGFNCGGNGISVSNFY
jgi:hypothetical protein